MSLTDRERDLIVAFLRDWLPEEAKFVYGQMILENPDGWWHDPHFAGDVILEHALRGNGITERALGIVDLGPLWPDLLARALDVDEPSPPRNEPS